MHLLIADDHELFRSGFTLLVSQLFSDASIVAVGDGDAAWEALGQDTSFDLVFVDLRIPHMYGLRGLRRFVVRKPAVPMVVLSASEDVKTIIECARLGALGYIPKAASEQVLKSAIALVLSGETFFPRAAVPGILAACGGSRHREPAPRKDLFPQLTQSQLAMLALIALMADGSTQNEKETARTLEVVES